MLSVITKGRKCVDGEYVQRDSGWTFFWLGVANPFLFVVTEGTNKRLDVEYVQVSGSWIFLVGVADPYYLWLTEGKNEH